jgi:hypothetical protein
METMGQLGQPGMQVFYSPELVEAQEKSAFLRDKLELMFKPSNDLKPLRLTRKSREYKIINEGNPQTYFLKTNSIHPNPRKANKIRVKLP